MFFFRFGERHIQNTRLALSFNAWKSSGSSGPVCVSFRENFEKGKRMVEAVHIILQDQPVIAISRSWPAISVLSSTSSSSLTWADLEFVKNFTRPNFPVKEFNTLKTRKSRLFSPTINSKNTSLSVIWPSFG